MCVLKEMDRYTYTSFGHTKYDIKSCVVNACVHVIRIVLLSGVDTESEYHSHITVERLETQNKQFFPNIFFFFFY